MKWRVIPATFIFIILNTLVTFLTPKKEKYSIKVEIHH